MEKGTVIIMKLHDKRLLVCADMVGGDFVCDIGTDHGYLPAYLLTSGKCSRAIAADINKMPLEAARATLEKEGVSDRAQLYLSDGLKEIPLDGVTDIVIAGMGGELIFRILSADERVKKCGANLILQPMTRALVLRKALAGNGFETIAEKGVTDGRFSYCVMKCRYTGKCRRIDDVRENIGLLDARLEDDRKYIYRQLERLEKTAQGISGSDAEKAAKIMKTAARIRKETGL